MCYQPHTNQTDFWQFLLLQKAKYFFKCVLKLACYIKFRALSTAILWLKITLYQSNCIAVMHYSFIGSLGIESYSTLVHFGNCS